METSEARSRAADIAGDHADGGAAVVSRLHVIGDRRRVLRRSGVIGARRIVEWDRLIAGEIERDVVVLSQEMRGARDNRHRVAAILGIGARRGE